MNKKVFFFIVVVSLVAVPFSSSFSAAQSSKIILNDEDTIFHWSREDMLLSAYYAELRDSASFGAVALQSVPAVNDPYYSSYGSWGQLYDDMWGIKRINIENAWKLSTGAGVVIAVIDTGVDYTHPDIDANMWINNAELIGSTGVDDDGNGYKDDIKGMDFYNKDIYPIDDHGHGSHVAGIIAAEGNNSTGIIGVAYKAKIMPVKLFSSQGSWIESDIPKAIRYAADTGAKVINCSFCFAYNFDMVSAFQYAFNKGCIIVASSGNDNNYIGTYPATLDYVITVGSMNVDNTRSWFSNYGSDLDVIAPGVDILSLWKTSYGSPTYARDTGTSMAAPFVSGVVALLLAQDPTLTTEGVLRRLKFSSQDLGSTGWDQYYGWGLIDAYAALSHDWYASGAVKTWWLTSADPDGAIRYDYYESGVIMMKWMYLPDGAYGVSRLEYDVLGQLVKKVYSNGEFITYHYWASGNKKLEAYYKSGWDWQKTIEYWEDGNTRHWQYVKDEHPGVDGDIIKYEYDNLGRLITQFDEGNNFINTLYWTGDADAKRKLDDYYTSSWGWLKAIEYWDDGVTKHWQYVPDADPGNNGDIMIYEHDNLGRLITQYDESFNFIKTLYWTDGTDAKRKLDDFYAVGWVWLKAILYWEDGVTMHWQYVPDSDPNTNGDIMRYEYDNLGRLITQYDEDFNFINTYYWTEGADAKRKLDDFYMVGWVWLKAIEYWEDGVTMHYQWIKDENPDVDGDDVAYTYDSNGVLISKTLDTGEVITVGGNALNAAYVSEETERMNIESENQEQFTSNPIGEMTYSKGENNIPTMQ